MEAPQLDELPPMISIAQAAAVLGVSVRSARRLAQSGRLPTTPAGVVRRLVPRDRFLRAFDLDPDDSP